jgi:hypothetical protein
VDGLHNSSLVCNYFYLPQNLIRQTFGSTTYALVWFARSWCSHGTSPCQVRPYVPLSGTSTCQVRPPVSCVVWLLKRSQERCIVVCRLTEERPDVRSMAKNFFSGARRHHPMFKVTHIYVTSRQWSGRGFSI